MYLRTYHVFTTLAIRYDAPITFTIVASDSIRPISVSLRSSLIDQLDALAESQGRSRSNLVERLLSQAVSEEPQREALRKSGSGVRPGQQVGTAGGQRLEGVLEEELCPHRNITKRATSAGAIITCNRCGAVEGKDGVWR